MRAATVRPLGTLPLTPPLTLTRCVRLLCGHSAPVRDVSASADGNLAASADEDGHVLLWHLASGAQHADPTLAPAPSPSPDPNPSPNPHPNPHPLTLTP